MTAFLVLLLVGAFRATTNALQYEWLITVVHAEGPAPPRGMDYGDLYAKIEDSVTGETFGETHKVYQFGDEWGERFAFQVPLSNVPKISLYGVTAGLMGSALMPAADMDVLHEYGYLLTLEPVADKSWLQAKVFVEAMKHYID